jgi:hypothetical protein
MHGAQIYFGDLTPYLTYDSYGGEDCPILMSTAKEDDRKYLRTILLYVPFRLLLIFTMYLWAGEGAGEGGMESILYGYS